MLCRAYTNVQDKKVLTAEKIIGMAENLINLIEDDQLEIVTFPEHRSNSNPYNLIMLKKKFFLLFTKFSQ